MKRWMGVSASVVAGAVLWSGIALGQTKSADCKPEKVEGQITSIDWKQGQEQGKLTVRGSDGKNYEFTASKETLADKKVGDRLEITKRMPENCK
jgi:hypothetical protein